MDTYERIGSALGALQNVPPTQRPILNLAYVGDTVYDLYVRTLLLCKSEAGAHELHLAAAKLVCAAGQARAFRRIEQLLTEEEAAIFHRGRNSHSASVPKNSSVADYRIATGLESLIGWLYLSGRDERLDELMGTALHES